MSWIREPNSEPIPGYRLIEPLGSGGFGEVWKCEAPGGIYKAIKFVFGNLNSLDVDCVRAEQELRALQRIKEVRHPFVCSLDRIEVVDGELVIVMELAERTLHDVFQDCVASGLIGIPRDHLLRYLADASEALDHMNEKHNLQHLDIKPRNLFLIGDRAKVADFGLVKHLERHGSSGMLGGVTPLYAAPETFHGKISAHSDQYSLAIVYQELLTGHRPYNGKNVRQLAQQHLQEEPDLRSLPEADRLILQRALAKDPSKRFPNCVALLSALYRARLPVKVPGKVEQEPACIVVGDRPETMRDIQLEAYDELRSSAEIDLNALPRAELDEDKSLVSDMGVTIAQPDSGALRPTLIIGVGAFGRKALLELRCRFMDRFGDLGKLPLMRFLYLDADPEASVNAVRGTPEVALTRNEFYPLPLQPVVKYRQRNLDQLSEWLPREKLFAMPRSLQTQGCRALGRLAFADNQQRLLARLRREILEITNPDIIYQSVTHTGLALRDTTPRVYVLGAAGGGSSGMLPDLGYALRRLLGQLRHPEAPVTLHLLAGAPQDPASPKTELANIFATLTELNHFSDPSIGFFAQYGTEGQRIVDQGPPFHATYLLPQQHRTPEALEQTVSHLGNYLFHELTTPLGLRLDNLRHDQDFSGMLHGVLEARFRSLGTFAVWFPRGLLLRQAARHAGRRLIDGWLTEGDAQLGPEARRAVDVFLEKISTLPNLQPDVLAQAIESQAQAGTPTDTGTAPGEVLAGMLVRMEEQILQPVAQEDPGNWARQALIRIREWVGTGEEGEALHDWRKTRLSRALLASAQQLADKLDQELSAELFGLMDLPGARVAAAELALKQLHSFCLRSAEEEKKQIHHHALAGVQALRALDQALQDCLVGGSGFRLFGGRSRSRNLRRFMECLAVYARQRLAEEVRIAVRQCYAMLAGKLNDRGRDVGFCRQRLRHLQECLESGPVDPEEELASTLPGADFTLSRSPLPSTEAYWDAIRQSPTARVLLPDGETDLERSSLRFLQSLLPEDWDRLDREIHERVLKPRGGLQGASLAGGDLARQLAQPLLEEAGELLGGRLPIMDVAQILAEELQGRHQGNGDAAELAQRIGEYLDRAAPLFAGKLDRRHHAFLLVPGSQAGRALGEAVALAFPQITQVRVAGQTDLMLCRDQGSLTAADLHAVLAGCRTAYENLSATPAQSPHARFDIQDWVPIDP